MTRPIRILALGCAAAVGAYGLYVAYAWSRYGRPAPPASWDRDPLLDQFIPVYDVVERHHALIDAPAGEVLAAACDQQLSRLPGIRTIFRARELLLRSRPDDGNRPRGLLAETTSLGWVILAEVPGREVVVGAVTKPWEANVTFRSIPAASFAAFDEPGYVKIVWTLRADPVGGRRAMFRTETRAVATDATARAKFRRYWALLSPGIIGIRWLAAAHLKQDVRQTRTRPASKVENAVRGR